MTAPESSLIATTPDTFTAMDENQNSSAAPVKNSCSEHGTAMLSLCGESSLTPAVKPESTAQSSETKAATLRASLSDRLTRSLITAGLVKGIIPLSIRDASGQTTLDAVLRKPDGESVDAPKADC